MTLIIIELYHNIMPRIQFVVIMGPIPNNIFRFVKFTMFVMHLTSLTQMCKIFLYLSIKITARVGNKIGGVAIFIIGTLVWAGTKITIIVKIL